MQRGQGRWGCGVGGPRPAARPRPLPACPAPTRVRGAPLTDGLVAQHGVEQAHLHLGAPHHCLLSWAGGRLPRSLVTRRAPAAHLRLSHGPGAQRRAPGGSGGATGSAQSQSRGSALGGLALGFARGAGAGAAASGSRSVPWRSAVQRSAAQRSQVPADLRKWSRFGEGDGNALNEAVAIAAQLWVNPVECKWRNCK